MMTQQIPLPLAITARYSWDNFYIGRNQELVNTLHAQPRATQGLLYLWGESGVGKSHLLQAASQGASEQGAKVFFLDLGQALFYTPDILADLNGFDMVCLDNIDAIAGQAEWELALFSLYNLIMEQDSTLIVTAARPATQTGIELPDLLSRLQQGLTFRIQPLDAADIKQAIDEQMQQYGFSGDYELVDYIANRTRRDMSALAENFSRLNEASLVEQRALSKPFIKKTLGW